MDIKKILFKTSEFDVEHSLPNAVILVANDGKIQWVNDIAADIFETSKMHLLTSNISDFIENPMILVETSISSNKPVIIKFKDKEQYFDMTARSVNGAYVLDIRRINDNGIVEKKEEEPGIINREKNNFLLKLSNDLKAPLQSIVGFSQAMTDGLGGQISEQQEKYIRIINKNSSELIKW